MGRSNKNKEATGPPSLDPQGPRTAPIPALVLPDRPHQGPGVETRTCPIGHARISKPRCAERMPLANIRLHASPRAGKGECAVVPLGVVNASFKDAMCSNAATGTSFARTTLITNGVSEKPFGQMATFKRLVHASTISHIKPLYSEALSPSSRAAEPTCNSPGRRRSGTAASSSEG